MTDIKWEDPPAPAHGPGSGGRWALIAEALRARPGEWAKVAEAVHQTTASNISNGRARAFQPAGSFEAVRRANPDDKSKFDIYARYVGTEATS